MLWDIMQISPCWEVFLNPLPVCLRCGGVYYPFCVYRSCPFTRLAVWMNLDYHSIPSINDSLLLLSICALQLFWIWQSLHWTARWRSYKVFFFFIPVWNLDKLFVSQLKASHASMNSVAFFSHYRITWRPHSLKGSIKDDPYKSPEGYGYTVL